MLLKRCISLYVDRQVIGMCIQITNRPAMQSQATQENKAKKREDFEEEEDFVVDDLHLLSGFPNDVVVGKPSLQGELFSIFVFPLFQNRLIELKEKFRDELQVIDDRIFESEVTVDLERERGEGGERRERRKFRRRKQKLNKIFVCNI